VGFLVYTCTQQREYLLPTGTTAPWVRGAIDARLSPPWGDLLLSFALAALCTHRRVLTLAKCLCACDLVDKGRCVEHRG